MTTAPQLSLAEAVLLLALHDSKGTPHTSMFSYAIGGALIADLLLRKKAAVEQNKNVNTLTVLDPAPCGDALLDECARHIHSAARPASLETWVGRLAEVKDLNARVADRLYKSGVLRKQEGRVLWVFTRQVYPTADPGPEHDLVEEIRAAVVTDGEVDSRTAVIIALAHEAGLLQYVLDKNVLHDRRHRLEEIARADVVGRAVREAIAAVHAALMAVTIATGTPMG